MRVYNISQTAINCRGKKIKCCANNILAVNDVQAILYFKEQFNLKNSYDTVMTKSNELTEEEMEDLATVDVKLIKPFYTKNTKFNEIDVLIADTIRILNEKGVETVACCSGHISYGKDDEGYLWIKNNIDVPQYVVDQCSKVCEEHNGGVTLRWKVESLGKNKERMKVFERWTKSL